MFVGSILKAKQDRYAAKKRRTNAVIKATASAPRLLVIRSLAQISAQVIRLDGLIIAYANDKDVKWTKSEKAFAVWKQIAEMTQKKWVNTVVFDRNWRIYHGRVAQVAAGSREWGLQF